MKDRSLEKRLINLKFITEYGSAVKEFQIVDISVQPQGVGAYISNLYNLDGSVIDDDAEDLISAIFIEIGYKTVEYVAFKNGDNGFILDTASGSLENAGTYRVCMDIQKLMGEKGNSYNADDIESAISGGNSILTNMDGNIDIRKFKEEAITKQAYDMSNLINQRFSDRFAKYKNVYLSGGGAESFYPEMKKYFSQLKLQNDPVFANARGYMAIENHNKMYM